LRHDIAVHLPQRAADFTPEWLSAALASTGSAAPNSVQSVSVRPLGMSTGLTSDLFLITPTYHSGTAGPATMLAKMSSEDEVTAALGSSLRLFQREVRFYQELARDAGVGVPLVYFADSEEDSGRYVILLEDLGRAGRSVPPHECSVEDAERVVTALASMHAKWWDSQRLKEMAWLAAGSSRNFNAAVQRKYLQAWAGVVDRFGSGFPKGVLEIAEALGPRIARVLDRCSASQVTLTHGTLMPEYVYVSGESDEKQVKLISWQAVGIRPGPWDLSFFLGFGLTIDDRRAHEMRLLRRYHDLLLGAGIDGYAFDRVVSEYRTGMFRLLAYIVIVDDNLDLSTPVGQGLVERAMERSVAVRDWKCAEVLPI
jgi:hypothetical protein